MKKITVDLINLQVIEDELSATAYYGGVVLVDDVEVFGHGSDRGDSYKGELANTIADKLGVECTENFFYEVDNLPYGRKYDLWIDEVGELMSRRVNS